MRYLPKGFKVWQNDYYPRLPLEDNYFDAVTAFSVFTHIDETESGWLLELRRILKPGGIAYLSIHDEETWKIKDGNLLATVRDYLPPEIADSPTLPVGKTVATFRQDDPYRCNVFHSREYINHVWGRYFEFLDFLPLRLDKQAIVVCRKQ
jgi:SAM-dependent methyltransferase